MLQHNDRLEGAFHLLDAANVSPGLCEGSAVQRAPHRGHPKMRLFTHKISVHG